MRCRLPRLFRRRWLDQNPLTQRLPSLIRSICVIDKWSFGLRIHNNSSLLSVVQIVSRISGCSILLRTAPQCSWSERGCRHGDHRSHRPLSKFLSQALFRVCYIILTCFVAGGIGQYPLHRFILFRCPKCFTPWWPVLAADEHER